MAMLQEISMACVHWSLGIAVLTVVTASEYSGASTIIALPITATTITISALCGASLNSTDASYKRRKFCDILDFLRIWLEILEILTAAATCARVASATVDYISGGRLREWFLGIQSHSLGEPWPDVLGVSVVIVITALFMLGLEKSPSFSALLLVALFTVFVFFVVVGGLHTIVSLEKWSEDLKLNSGQSILTAATLCSYGFVSTFPKMSSHKTLKIITMVFVPLLLYSSTILVFTLMSHYNKELTGSATPLLRVFELRDVDWARLVMAIGIISIACLTLTEILPSLYGLFVTLASKEWQIFLTSLQYKSSFTGAPILAIFAAGSLAAILAFACPLAYLVKILNTSTLLKCIVRSIQVLYYKYKPEFDNGNYLVNSTSAHYSKLNQTAKPKHGDVGFKNKIRTLFSGMKKHGTPPGINSKARNKGTVPSQDDEYLLLNDYCDKPADLTVISSDSTDESDIERESVLSSDAEDSYSSTDIDAVVQEYKDKVQVATIDNFGDGKNPTYVTAVTVAIFLLVSMTSAVCFSQAMAWKRLNLTWPCLAAALFSTIVVLLMPRNRRNLENNLLPSPLVAFCAIISIQLNIVLVATIIRDVWPGFVFWICSGGLLFWRCDCCTCDGLLNQRSKLNITENIAQYPDKYVDTILIAR